MDEFDAEISGGQAVADGLARVAARVGDTPALAREAGRILSVNLAERLRAGGDPPYPDIKPESRARRRHDKTSVALIDGGDLLRALLSQSPGGAGAFRAIHQVAADGLTKGVEGDGVRRLQEGFHGKDSRGRNIDQAARKFLDLTPGDEREIRDATEADLGRAVEESFGA